jgi:hypothetical protein
MEKKRKSGNREIKFRKREDARQAAFNALVRHYEREQKKGKYKGSSSIQRMNKAIYFAMQLLQGHTLCEADKIPDTLNALAGSAINYKSEKSEYGYVPAEYPISFFTGFNGAGEFVEKEPDLDYLKRTGILGSLDQIMKTGILEIKINLKNHSHDRIEWELRELLKVLEKMKKLLIDNGDHAYNDPPKVMNPNQIYDWLEVWSLRKSDEWKRDKDDMRIAKTLRPGLKDKRKLESIRVNVQNWYESAEEIVVFLEKAQLQKKNSFFIVNKSEPEYFI